MKLGCRWSSPEGISHVVVHEWNVFCPCADHNKSSHQHHTPSSPVLPTLAACLSALVHIFVCALFHFPLSPCPKPKFVCSENRSFEQSFSRPSTSFRHNQTCLPPNHRANAIIKPVASLGGFTSRKPVTALSSSFYFKRSARGFLRFLQPLLSSHSRCVKVGSLHTSGKNRL